MKKHLLIILCVAFLGFSCSNDDSSSSSDPLIGVWKPFKEFENNVEIALEACRDMDRLTFNTEGISHVLFYETELDGSCILEEDRAGTWVNDSGNMYTTTFDNLPSATQTTELFFEGNTFYVESTEFDGVIDPVLVTRRQVFIKVD